MNARTKLLVVVYLVLWTTAIAWLAVASIQPMFPNLYTDPWNPARGVLVALPKLTPFFAAPIALYQAAKVLRRKSKFDSDMLLRYFIGAPAWIFLALLILLSLPTFVWAPVVFVIGFFYGLIPLFLGTLLHCLGMVPLSVVLAAVSRRQRDAGG